MLQMTAIPILVIFLSFCYSAQLQETTPVGCQSSFPCRGLGILRYPFFSSMQNECGLIEVDCYHMKIKLGNESQWYDVLTSREIYDNLLQERFESRNWGLEIHDNLLQERLESRSCDSFKNITLPSSPSISYTILNSKTTFVRCTDNSKVTAEYFGGYYNYTGCPGYSLYYTYPYDDDGRFTVASLPPTCSISQMPVERSRDRKYTSDPFQIITANLSVRWDESYECFQCYYESRGKCSTNNHQEFQCIGGKQGTRAGTRAAIPIVVLIGTFGAAIVILIVVVFSLRRKIATKWRNIFDSLTLKRYRYSDIKKVVMKWRKNFNSLPPKRYRYSDIKKVVMKWRKKTKSHRTVKTFLKNYASLTPKRYRHSDIKKMTNSFKDKLGEGGYGSVYKGKFRNGSLVAVKVLKESKGDGDEFFNEVASISRTSHVNVVTLLGFCIEGRKRALVYEFMPNGSLEKFAYDRTSSTNRQLGWDKYYRIAIGIARGLEYLHRGCNTRILHFDIKPHNILLDEDFVPKISDFGLAKLCPGKESAISMLNARGTIGYIAPEVFCRNIGRVSHKSDVYSYGMMVLEMVGWRRNVEVEVGHTSEIYFPDWIYRKLELDKELGMHGITNEDENVYARKMIIVSLWCIQSNPSTRPSMSRVVEMLEGSLESLEIPPEPILSSPQLSPSHSSTIESTIEIS